jgi:hypothetical protein
MTFILTTSYSFNILTARLKENSGRTFAIAFENNLFILKTFT